MGLCLCSYDPCVILFDNTVRHVQVLRRVFGRKPERHARKATANRQRDQ